MKRTLAITAVVTFAMVVCVVAALAVTITLTPEQVGSVIAQQGGAPPPPVVTPTPTPTPPVGAISCPGYVNTRVLELNWQLPQRMLTSSVGGFGPDDALVVKFTTGGLSSTNNLPHVTATDFQSAPSSRTAVLSASPCDWSPKPQPGAMHLGNTITALFGLGAGSGMGYYPVLTLNTVYYLNIKNSPGSGCRASGVCDMSVDLIKGSL